MSTARSSFPLTHPCNNIPFILSWFGGAIFDYTLPRDNLHSPHNITAAQSRTSFITLLSLIP